jgi:hypothetical protein
MNRLLHSSEFYIDMTFVQQKITKALHEAIEEHITEMFRNSEASVNLPFEWTDQDGYGNPPVEDPLTLYTRIDGVFDDENGLVWVTNFRDAINDAIWLHTDVAGSTSPRDINKLVGSIYKSDAEKVLVPIRDELLKEVAKLNHYIDNAEDDDEVTRVEA